MTPFHPDERDHADRKVLHRRRLADALRAIDAALAYAARPRTDVGRSPVIPATGCTVEFSASLSRANRP